MNPLAPKYPPISLDPPTAADLALDESLRRFTREHIPVESEKELQKRQRILANLVSIFKQWVKDVALHEHNFSEEIAEEAGGLILTSGSYKLGIHEPGADIDTVCVAPVFCTSASFFGSLKERLQQHPQITNLIAIESASVPIITFDFENINIDLSLAILPGLSVKQVDLLDDMLLQGVDEATAKSLNGPRVTNMIEKIVTASAGTDEQKQERYGIFLEVLRCVRKWAKARGIYGNKQGYLGGVNFNILVAMIFQLYPKASFANLLVNFFKVYKVWDWSNTANPVQLNHIVEYPNLALEVWKPEKNMYHLMPIITPAYPAMNSSFNVNQYTLAVMKEEFDRGYRICEEVVRNGGIGWERLFEPTDFFVKYSKYLACEIITTHSGEKGGEEKVRMWTGYMESRIRRFPECIGRLPLSVVHLHPKALKSEPQPGVTCLTYFTGIEIDKSRLKDDTLQLDHGVQNFYDVARLDENMVEGCDFHVELLNFKALPKEVFTPLGGKARAKELHKEIMAAKAQKAAAAAAASEAAAAEQDTGEVKEGVQDSHEQLEVKQSEDVESKETEMEMPQVAESKPKKRRRSDKLEEPAKHPVVAVQKKLPLLLPTYDVEGIKSKGLASYIPSKRIRSVTFEFLT